MAIVAYCIHSQDAGNLMFPDKAMGPRCPTCGYRLDFFVHNPAYTLRKTAYDVYSTYDSQRVVSRKFKTFCQRRKIKGLTFHTFDRDPEHFFMTVEPVIPFDAIRRKTRFLKLCPTCGNYESVIGTNPSYLKVREPLLKGIFRSDLLFASGDGKHPLTFAGIETKAEMEEAGLALRFTPAEGLPTE